LTSWHVLNQLGNEQGVDASAFLLSPPKSQEFLQASSIRCVGDVHDRCFQDLAVKGFVIITVSLKK